jgi:DNA-binding transcriptional MerR regulator
MAVEIDTHGNLRRGGKSAAAFRTISEVADDLKVPPHVLRFWETKFSQVRPLKRGGGRRYYRPEDVALLKRIRELLYSDGYTIKGVQRLLRDGTVKPQAVAEEREEHPAAAPAVVHGDTHGNDTGSGGLHDRTRGEIAEVLDELLALKQQLVAIRR